MLDFQFEVLTTYLNDGGQLPQRSRVNNAHAYLAAPYGIYATADGYLALAMMPVPRLGELLDLPALDAYADPQSWFDQRDEIKQHIAAHLRTRSTRAWLDRLEPADVWCADVLDWTISPAIPAFQALHMVQTVERAARHLPPHHPLPHSHRRRTAHFPTGAPRVGAILPPSAGSSDSIENRPPPGQPIIREVRVHARRTSIPKEKRYVPDPSATHRPGCHAEARTSR